MCAAAKIHQNLSNSPAQEVSHRSRCTDNTSIGLWTSLNIFSSLLITVLGSLELYVLFFVFSATICFKNQKLGSHNKYWNMSGRIKYAETLILWISRMAWVDHLVQGMNACFNLLSSCFKMMDKTNLTTSGDYSYFPLCSGTIFLGPMLVHCLRVVVNVVKTKPWHCHISTVANTTK